jgi:membrane protein DedA with SNARE-associated domain
MYVVLAVLIIASAVPIAAAVLPAEPLLFAAVALTAHDRTSVAVLLVVAVLCSLTGDVLSFWLGHRFGARLVELRGVRRFRGRLTTAAQAVRSRGMVAVVIQRWAPPGRGFVPAIIGATNQPFGRFVGMAAVAAALWGSVVILAAYYCGPGLLMVALPVLTAVIVARAVRSLAARIRRRRSTVATVHERTSAAIRDA